MPRDPRHSPEGKRLRIRGRQLARRWPNLSADEKRELAEIHERIAAIETQEGDDAE